MNDPRWLTIALEYLGKREIPGAPTAPFLTKMLRAVKAPWSDDETPWCGTAVGAWMLEAGIEIPKNPWRALAWLGWGVTLAAPIVGCVVVFTRKGGGHVGFVVGKDAAGNLLVLGGNQGDAVTIRAFPLSRVAGYRWPAPGPAVLTALPVLTTTAFSTSEA